jgi:recombination protein RecR
MLPEPIEKLAEMFRMFPGIGLRSSQKLSLDLLESSEDDYSQFVEALQHARKNVQFCSNCGFFAEANGERTKETAKAEKLFGPGCLCEMCKNLSRNPYQICVTEKPTDVMTLERSQIYRGHYHIIQKLVSPLDNIFPEDTMISELFTHRIPRLLEDKELQLQAKKYVGSGQQAQPDVELILFFKAGFEGEATSAYIRELISQKGWTDRVHITRLAQGLPLYYNPDSLDQATMAKALEDRRPV